VLDDLRALPHVPICRIAGISHRPTPPMHWTVDGGSIPAVVAGEQPAQHHHALVALVSTPPMPHEHQGPWSRRSSGVPHHARNHIPIALNGTSTLTDPTDAHSVFSPTETRHVSLSSFVVHTIGARCAPGSPACRAADGPSPGVSRPSALPTAHCTGLEWLVQPAARKGAGADRQALCSTS